jgi:excisionase family DNA binding protein
VSDRLTVSQAAAALGVSERTIRRRCAAGKIEAELVSTETGATWLIPLASLGIASSEIQPADAAAPGAASHDDTEIAHQPQLARLESDVAQIKAYLAGQMSARLEQLEEENARLRAELAAQRPQRVRSWWANLLSRKPPQLPPGE